MFIYIYVDADAYDSEDDVSLPIPDVDELYQRSVVVTTDNAANVSKAIIDSGMLHIRCYAHTLNLSVQKFVRSIDGQLAFMRPIVKFFHKSPGADSLLKVCL